MEIPLIDTSNGTNFTSMFYKNLKITTIQQLDLSNGVNFFQMFCYCNKLTNIPKFNTSKGINFYSMYFGCAVTDLPELSTENGTNFSYMFGDCKNLKTIQSINMSKGKTYRFAFRNCTSLSNITFVGTVNIRTNELSFSQCPLSEESLASLVNALSDNSGLDTTYAVTLGATNIAKLTEEQLAIVAAKNINLT